MQKLITLSLLALAACTYNNDRQPRSSDELARYNDQGQNIAPDSTMYQPQQQDNDQPRVIVVPMYHGPGYYQSNPNQYYSDPHSVYNDPRSSLYHQNYGRDGYARAKAQASADARRALLATPPAAPRVYRKVGMTAASRGPVAQPRFAATPSRTFTVPTKTAPPVYSAPIRTYTAPRVYSAPTPTRTISAPARVYSAPARVSAPTYHYTPSVHVSTPSHH